jgi:hypothetical protein
MTLKGGKHLQIGIIAVTKQIEHPQDIGRVE